MSRPVVVLGATGSIGTQALEVADKLGLEVVALAARTPTPEYLMLARQHPQATLILTGGSSEERDWFVAELSRPVETDMAAIVEVCSVPGRTVVNGIVGSAGLEATVAAVAAGNRLALANKESLVAGGAVVKAAMTPEAELIPVDSEHSALHQCLLGEPRSAVRRVMLTASGGPFRGRRRAELETVTPEEALRHPIWDMGRRITIDSATLFNKGLEVIEAHHLFDLDFDQIEVVVHPQSILHSAIEFVDGSWKGHMGHPDMRIPIQYALTSPDRFASPAPSFEFAGASLSFEPVDNETFPAVDLAYEAGRRGGSHPAVLNAADEVAVEAFLQGRLGFLGITEVVSRTLETVTFRSVATVADVIEADREARSVAASLVAGAC